MTHITSTGDGLPNTKNAIYTDKGLLCLIDRICPTVIYAFVARDFGLTYGHLFSNPSQRALSHAVADIFKVCA